MTQPAPTPSPVNNKFFAAILKKVYNTASVVKITETQLTVNDENTVIWTGNHNTASGTSTNAIVPVNVPVNSPHQEEHRGYYYK